MTSKTSGTHVSLIERQQVSLSPTTSRWVLAALEPCSSPDLTWAGKARSCAPPALQVWAALLCVSWVTETFLQSFLRTWALLFRAAQRGAAFNIFVPPVFCFTRLQVICCRSSLHSCWSQRQDHVGPKHIHGGNAGDRVDSAPRYQPVQTKTETVSLNLLF